MFEKLEAHRPVSRRIEEFLRQYAITDFACTAFEDTLLLAAKIEEHQITPVGIGFNEPDFVRMFIQLTSTNLKEVDKFFEFVQKYDNSASLEKTEPNDHTILMNCSNCFEKILPLFETLFLKRINEEKERIEIYQRDSKKYYEGFLHGLDVNTKTNIVSATKTPLSNTSTTFNSNTFFPPKNSQETIKIQASPPSV